MARGEKKRGSESRSSDSESASGSSSHSERNKQPIPADEAIVIRVHNLTRNVRSAHVREIFGKFGTIKTLESFETDPICDFPKGRCTIEYSTNEEAIEAFANMKGAQIDGEEVSVSLIKIRRVVLPKVNKSPSRSPSPSKGKRRPPSGKKGQFCVHRVSEPKSSRR
eukprot:RCo024501